MTLYLWRYFMERSPYTKYERLRLVKECVEWCKIKGNSVAQFARLNDIKRTGLYNWKNTFSNILDLNNLPSSNDDLDALLDSVTIKNQMKKFVKVKGLKTLSTNLQIIDDKKADKKADNKDNIIIKTKFCTIEVPCNSSKDSIFNLLASIKEVQ